MVAALDRAVASRELEVLRMRAAGRSNQAIAGELVVTLDTVEKHVGHVLGKLDAANRTEAVARARQLSLIPLPAAGSPGPRRRSRPGQVRPTLCAAGHAASFP